MEIRKCVSCGSPARPGRVQCEKCAYRKKARVQKLKEAGLCPSCSGEASAGRVYCDACTAKLKAYEIRRRAAGLCRRCGQPARPGRATCVACGEDNRRREQERRKKLPPMGPDRAARVRATNMVRIYGITPAEFDAMVEAQGGVCAICGQPERTRDGYTGKSRRLAIDHDHLTGKVRGLLCQPCNTSLKRSMSPALLRKMADYLERHADAPLRVAS